MIYAQNYNILAFRPGEEWELTRVRPAETKQYERVYIVAVVETPEFPFSDFGIHEECRRKVVIAAEIYPTIKAHMKPRIGWVMLEPDAKAAIGTELERQKAQAGEWFSLILDTRKYRGGE